MITKNFIIIITKKFITVNDVKQHATYVTKNLQR